MTTSKNVELVKDLVETLFKKMTFDDFSVEIKGGTGENAENIVFNIKTQESNLIIGQYGTALRAFQHIVRVLARKKTADKLRIQVDVNNYSQQRNESLEGLACDLANQAVSEKRPMVMRPMSAYERRIVHLKLSTDQRIKTESIGEGEERKIVISPVGSLEEV